MLRGLSFGLRQDAHFIANSVRSLRMGFTSFWISREATARAPIRSIPRKFSCAEDIKSERQTNVAGCAFNGH